MQIILVMTQVHIKHVVTHRAKSQHGSTEAEVKKRRMAPALHRTFLFQLRPWALSTSTAALGAVTTHLTWQMITVSTQSGSPTNPLVGQVSRRTRIASAYLEQRSTSTKKEKGESLKRKGNVRRERNVRRKEGVKEEDPRRRKVRKESRRGGTKLYDQNL